MRKRSPRDQRFGLSRKALDGFGRSEVRLGEDHRAAIHAQQVENRQMFERLRHDPVIDGDCQKREIDSARAREHRVNETLVAWNINEADPLPGARGHIGEAQIDRDAARLLILQPVAIDARQGFDQRRLAVIDMTGEADNHGRAPVAGRSSDGRGIHDPRQQH